MSKYIKKPVEDWLRETDYVFMGYMPTDEALLFVNFIKEVNGGAEENETPLVHLKMMDNVFNKEKRCAILCHRGIGKTTLFAEYLILFMAAFGIFPGFGLVNLVLYVTDSIENGVKNLRRNVEFRYNESDFLQKLIPNQRISVGTDGAGFVSTSDYETQVSAGRKFTDIRLEFRNNKNHVLVVKGYGAKALSLDSTLYTDTGTTTIGECKIGDKIYGPNGHLTAIIAKSEVFHKPMYRINLSDGRSIKVSEDHINPVVINTNPNNTVRWEEKNLTTKELLQIPLVHTKKGNKHYRGTSSKHLVFIKNCTPVFYRTKRDLPIDPYVLGLLIGDGSLKKDGSTILHGHREDIAFYKKHIRYELGSEYADKRNHNVVSLTIKGLSSSIRELGLAVHGDYKFVPIAYKQSSFKQRLCLLQGLLDTDGTISERKINPVVSFTSNSKILAHDVAELVYSLGGSAQISRTGKKAYRVFIKLNLPTFALPRKRDKVKNNYCTQIAITSIEPIPLEPSQCIAVDNEDHQFLTDNYVRTHNTGVRGAKELGKRPTIAILDDLVSDTDAESQTVINTIENTVYKAVSKALHPTRQKMIWLGTPFNARDPLYKAVESGAWNVSVYPICEKFPVTEEDFRGSWEDRFPYTYVKDEYDEAIALGKPENFNQELMLRIMSDEDRLIHDDDICWYKRKNILKNINAFNYYITTDFATSKEQASDFSVISVWAVNYKGYFYWIDGICEQQDMAKNVYDLFRLAQKWNPQSVGIEVSGQQGGFVSLIMERMLDRNIYFNLASEGNKGKPGIRPVTNKMVRFNSILPKFKSREIFFPIEMKNEKPMLECINELTLAAKSGFKSKKDDFIDNISQLSSLTIWRPSEPTPMVPKNNVYEMEEEQEISTLSSYVV